MHDKYDLENVLHSCIVEIMCRFNATQETTHLNRMGLDTNSKQSGYITLVDIGLPLVTCNLSTIGGT